MRHWLDSAEIFSQLGCNTKVCKYLYSNLINYQYLLPKDLTFLGGFCWNISLRG